MRLWIKQLCTVLGLAGILAWGIVVLLIAMALVAPGKAHAAPVSMVAYMVNQNGGRIELFNLAPPASVVRAVPVCKDTLVARAWGGDIEDVAGCWFVAGDTITIKWLWQGTVASKTYYLRSFTPVRAKR